MHTFKSIDVCVIAKSYAKSRFSIYASADDTTIKSNLQVECLNQTRNSSSHIKDAYEEFTAITSSRTLRV